MELKDGGQRSSFVLQLSNGTNIPITGPTNSASSPPRQLFGYVLDSASIVAGIHINSIVWSGLDASGELIGYWDIVTSVPSLDITVTGNAPTTAQGQSTTIPDAGDTISFTVVVTNTALASTAPIRQG